MGWPGFDWFWLGCKLCIWLALCICHPWSSYLIDVLLMVMTSARPQAQLCKLISSLPSYHILIHSFIPWKVTYLHSLLPIPLLTDPTTTSFTGILTSGLSLSPPSTYGTFSSCLSVECSHLGLQIHFQETYSHNKNENIKCMRKQVTVSKNQQK